MNSRLKDLAISNDNLKIDVKKQIISFPHLGNYYSPVYSLLKKNSR